MLPLTDESKLSDREAHLIERAAENIFAVRTYLVYCCREGEKQPFGWQLMRGDSISHNDLQAPYRFFELPISSNESSAV